MAGSSSIEWTEFTWNPVTGCTKVSQGCKNCYAERLSKRLVKMGAARYANGFRVTLHHDLVDLPRRWKRPRRVFVNSMSDLFHPEVPAEFIHAVFRTMRDCPQHVFQVLTKRGDRLREVAAELEWSPNIWMGVSVENSAVLHRVDALRAVPAHVRFLSCEPLIGPLDSLDLQGIHWVIVGGESGPGSRQMDVEWVQAIRSRCEQSSVPFFFKQWGGVQKHRTGRLLDGITHDGFPTLALTPTQA
ncbi:MAG: phage Gp37/Gp68 family protein [Fimbriimonadaceae bacterium]|nr:phage Gp37/Gp68 family protein [Fimbriimonadaceae bacterium]